jgi:hypothetical protein
MVAQTYHSVMFICTLPVLLVLSQASLGKANAPQIFFICRNSFFEDGQRVSVGGESVCILRTGANQSSSPF